MEAGGQEKDPVQRLQLLKPQPPHFHGWSGTPGQRICDPAHFRGGQVMMVHWEDAEITSGNATEMI